MDNQDNSKFPAVTEGRIGGNLVQTVNARDLHAFLVVKSEFRNWIKNRIDEFGFTENVDYATTVEIYRGGERKNYFITLDMGKELGMVERTPKGKEVRQYFIECERRAHSASTLKIPTTAEAFASAFQMIAEAQRVQVQQAAEIAATNERVDRMEQALIIHDKVPPNGELVTYMRLRLKKEFGLSPDLTNKVLDVFSVHPKFAVRNHHERADGGVNYGYWKREINAVVRRFIDECKQVTAAMCEHPFIEGRFRMVKEPVAPKPRRSNARPAADANRGEGA
ncbi:MAG: antA/AntB antirepressor family protein [Agrobacterium cavarae]